MICQDWWNNEFWMILVNLTRKCLWAQDKVGHAAGQQQPDKLLYNRINKRTKFIFWNGWVKVLTLFHLRCCGSTWNKRPNISDCSCSVLKNGLKFHQALFMTDQQSTETFSCYCCTRRHWWYWKPRLTYFYLHYVMYHVADLSTYIIK